MAYRVVVIGFGKMGRTHTRHWTAQPDAEVVGILDPCLAERDSAPVPVYETFEAMIKQTKPDIVDICTPAPLHAPYALQAAAAGYAIFCEKPLARSLEDCDAIVAAVERAGVPLMGGHVVRYFPAYASAKRVVVSGGVGAPAVIHAARLSAFPGANRPDNWYGDLTQSGGVVLDLMLHDFDWLRWCFGEVARVFAKGLIRDHALAANRLDYALVTLRFRSGALAHVTGSWAHPGGFRTTFEIAGDGGMLEFDSDKTAPLTMATRKAHEEGGGSAVAHASPLAAHQDPYFCELRAFLDALEQGAPPPVTVYDAREAVRIGLAALESIQTGKAVTFV